jgi:tape measure domain-containing protein
MSRSKIADLFVKISADGAEFDKSIAGLPKALENAGRRIQSVGLGLAKYVSLPILGIGTAVGVAGVKMDTARRSLAAVAGSAEEASRQLEVLRDVAKAPGLGFLEAIQGAVRLQAVGMSFDTTARSLRAFGNAIATTGGGKAELDRVTVQLGQLSAKGKILGQDLRPIIEAAPAVGQALKQAFGTVDASDIEALGLSTEEFLDRLVTQLEKLPKVAGGPKNAFENMQDSAMRLADRLSNEFLPAVADAMDGLARFAERGEGISGALVRLGGSFAIVLAALAPVTLGIWGMVAAAGALAGALSIGLGPVLLAVAAVVGGLTGLVSWYVKSAKAADEAAASARQFGEALKSQSREVVLAAMLAEEQRLTDLQNAPLWDQRMIAASTLRLQELRKQLDAINGAGKAGGAGDGISTRGWGPFPPLSLLGRITQELDRARERLADLQFKAGLPQTAEDAAKLAEQIAQTRREIEAMVRAFGTLREAGARALVAIAPALTGASVNDGRAYQGVRIVDGVPATGGIRPIGANPRPLQPESRLRVEQAALAAASSDLSQAFDGVAAAAYSTQGRFSSLVGSLATFGQSVTQKLGAGAIIGAGMAVFQGIAGLLGGSPEDQERQRIQQENTDALRRLSSGVARLGDVLRNTRGADLPALGAAATRAAQFENFGKISVSLLAFRSELVKLGLTFEEAQSIAKGYGIELDGSRESLRAFSEAIRKVQVSDLFQSFGGKGQLAELQAKLFGLDSGQQLQSLVQRFLESTNLGTLGEGLLTTDMEAFQSSLRALFQALPALDFSAFGDLSLNDFLEAIGQMFDLSEAASDAAENLNKMSESLANVPSILKVSLARFNATTPAGFAGAAALSGGARPTDGGIVIEGDLILQGVQDPEGLYNAVVERAARTKARGGATKLSRVTRS